VDQRRQLCTELGARSSPRASRPTANTAPFVTRALGTGRDTFLLDPHSRRPTVTWPPPLLASQTSYWILTRFLFPRWGCYAGPAPMDPLDNRVQEYDWGSAHRDRRAVGQTSPSARPQAEMWLGSTRRPFTVEREGRWGIGSSTSSPSAPTPSSV